ncbi:hypothetical protein L3Q82_015939 [Xyrichtys novacula]|uniref:Uncharacterized protein n=1 Tax=Xyrichtys novacula TaxID=13765 RepID=A0AAV1HGP0_XYRNO|nr:hypothetical protein L3Q82_015939 [Xyrichtys novacula]
MTAKHRRGKNNHKHEDNFFKNDITETEVRSGATNYALLLVLFLMIVIGGAIGAWFCFQQHQTLTYLTDNLMGMQMKIVKLQASHEDLRQSSSKPFSESLETRLIALEESYALAQKQVGMALATAEQLRTSDLPAQVLSLHTEMKTRLAEMQQATVSLEQLSQLQSMLKGKSDEFDGVKVQVDGLAKLNTDLSEKVEVLMGSLGEAESKLEERAEQVGTLSATLDEQSAEVLRLKTQLATYEAQLEASTQEMATVRELLESEKSQQLQQASVEEQLNTMVEETPAEPEDKTEEETAPVADEVTEEAVKEEALPADQNTPSEEVEAEEVAEADEGAEAAAQDEAPVEQEDSVTDETAPSEEVEAAAEDQTGSVSEKEEEDTIQAEEEEVQEEVTAEEENVSEGEEVFEEEEEQDVAAEDEEEDAVEENNDLPQDNSLSSLTESLGPASPPSHHCCSVSVPQSLTLIGDHAGICSQTNYLLQVTSNLYNDFSSLCIRHRPRSYLTPVRDEEAESQRKAKSRHARQTRRSTQGVTLTDLKEAQKTFSLPPQDRQAAEGGTLDERSCLRKNFAEDRRVRIDLAESIEQTEISRKWSKVDEEGNFDTRLETLTECSVPNLSYPSTAESCGLTYCNSSYRVGERWRRDENQNPIEETAELTFTTKQRRRCCAVDGPDSNTSEVIRRVDLSQHKPLQLFLSSVALCSTSPYPRPHQWTILALGAECCHSRASGRLPALKTGGRGEAEERVQGGGGLEGRPSSERRERESAMERECV